MRPSTKPESLIHSLSLSPSTPAIAAILSLSLSRSLSPSLTFSHPLALAKLTATRVHPSNYAT